MSYVLLVHKEKLLPYTLVTLMKFIMFLHTPQVNLDFRANSNVCSTLSHPTDNDYNLIQNNNNIESSCTGQMSDRVFSCDISGQHVDKKEKQKAYR